MPRSTLPQLIGDRLHAPTGAIEVGSSAWFAWLERADTGGFSIPGTGGAVTVRREPQGGSFYWYAYRRQGARLRKAYLGKSSDMTTPRLQAVVESLAPPETAARNGAAGPLRLHLLGAPRLTRGPHELRPPSSKALALLARLALGAAPQSRPQLLALLWPESAEEAARKNLRNMLWTVRAALGEVVLTQGERLALQPDLWVDVQVFERRAGQEAADRAALREAVELYRGPLLDGVHMAEAADLDLWLVAERERLGQQFSQAARRLVELERAAGAWEAIVPVAQQALTYDGLQEWPYRALMEARARQGDRAAALRQYELLRATLDRELGAAPDPETEALHDAIVRGAFERATRPPPPVPVRMNQPSSAPFVGRAAERAALDAELAAAGATTRMLALSGELGIGKSRLWQMWAAQVDPSVTVLEARCLASLQQMPFAPLIALFSHRVWRDRFAAVAGAAPPAWLEDLGLLLPTLQETFARPLLSRVQPDDQRQRVFEALVQALQTVARPPLVLFLDDVQWADATTLDWLDYLAQRELPLLLVLAYRAEDAPRPLLQRLAQWSRDGLLRRVMLNRLSMAEGAALLGALGVPRAEAAGVYSASAGNPYFLSELAHARPGDVPVALADLVRARIAGLPEAARQVLQAAAVLEPDIDAATIWRIAGRDEDETLDALDVLLQAAVLTEQADGYAFAHPLVATLVREDLSRARRATLHRRAATALEQLYAGRLPAHAGRIMAHFGEAGASLQAAHYAELAGDYALTVAAPAEAIRFYEQALAVQPTAARFAGFGRANIWRGDLDRAAAAFERALELFQAGDDTAGAAWALLQLADIGTMRSQYDAATLLAERALALSGGSNPAVAAAAHVLIGTGRRVQGAPLQAEPHVAEAIRLASEANLPDILTYCYVGLSNIRAEQGDLAGSFAAARQIVRYAQQSGNHFYEAVGYNNAAHRALLLGDTAAASAFLEQGLRLVEERALEVPRQWLYSTRGELALAEREWDVAENWFRRGMVYAERTGNHGQVAMYRANLGRAARGRGALAAAAELLEQARHATASETAAFQQAQIDLWLAETYHQQHRHGDAASALARVEARLAAGVSQLAPEVAALRAQLTGAPTERAGLP